MHELTPERDVGPSHRLRWAHGRRKFFELADVSKRARDARITLSPIAVEAVKRIDAIFAIEREINGLGPDDRHAVRQARMKPLVDGLQAWMIAERERISSKIKLANAMDYSKRWLGPTSRSGVSSCKVVPSRLL